MHQHKYVIVASAGSVEPEKIIGTTAKIDNSTVGYTLNFKPSKNKFASSFANFKICAWFKNLLTKFII